MIDNGAQAGMTLKQPQEGFEMLRKTKCIEGEIKVYKGVKRPLHIRAVHPFWIGKILDHRPHTDEFRMLLQALQLRKVIAFLKRPA